jgi:hypothetical protein
MSWVAVPRPHHVRPHGRDDGPHFGRRCHCQQPFALPRRCHPPVLHALIAGGGGGCCCVAGRGVWLGEGAGAGAQKAGRESWRGLPVVIEHRHGEDLACKKL